MANNNPWGALNAAAERQELRLEPEVWGEVIDTFDTYEQSLQTLINDSLNETNGYFGKDTNPLATQLEEAFNARGSTLTDYVVEQHSRALDFEETVYCALEAFRAAESP